jgi:DNA-binding transcriptional regulator LsrR (DeoR family)
MEQREQSLTFAQVGTLFRLTSDVVQKTGLLHTHIVPAEVAGHDLWEETKKGGANISKFNALLGSAASSIISRELQTTFTLKSASSNRNTFRIGVAGGQTTYFAVNGMPRLTAGSFRSSFEVYVAPLVIGSVPRHRYSAGTVAEMMASRIMCQDTNSASVDKVEEWFPEHGGTHYRVEFKEDIRQERETLEASRKPEISARGFFDLNYVLVGIGQYNKEDKTTNLSAHIEALYPKPKGPPPGLEGDICSRLFDNNGQELDPDKQNMFVAISFRVLELLVEKKIPVIAVAGGLSKVEAIKTITAKRLQARLKPLINGLITDELTAMQLLK